MTSTVSKTYDHREGQTIALLGFIALAIVGYIFFTYGIAFQIKEIGALEHKTSAVAKEITSLETRAFALRNSITLELALARGFLASEPHASYLASRSDGQE
jgi:prepilin signal peptidase PulO-like enzyme (type II secretory pathway)